MSKEIEKLLKEVEFAKNTSRSVGIAKQAQNWAKPTAIPPPLPPSAGIPNAKLTLKLEEILAKESKPIVNLVKTMWKALNFPLTTLEKALPKMLPILRKAPVGLINKALSVAKNIPAFRIALHAIPGLQPILIAYDFYAAIPAIYQAGKEIAPTWEAYFEKSSNESQQAFFGSPIYKEIASLFRANNMIDKLNGKAIYDFIKQHPETMTNANSDQILQNIAKAFINSQNWQKAYQNYKGLVENRQKQKSTQQQPQQQTSLQRHMQYFNNALNKFNQDTGSNLKPITLISPEAANLKTIEDFNKLPQVQEVIKKQNELNQSIAQHNQKFVPQTKPAHKIRNFTKIAQAVGILKADGLWGPLSQSAWQQFKAVSTPAKVPTPTPVPVNTKVEPKQSVQPVDPSQSIEKKLPGDESELVTSTDIPSEFKDQLRKDLATIAAKGDLNGYYNYLRSLKQPGVLAHVIQGGEPIDEIKSISLHVLINTFNKMFTKLSDQQKNSASKILENLADYLNKLAFEDSSKYVYKYIENFNTRLFTR